MHMGQIKPGTPIVYKRDIPPNRKTEQRDATAERILEMWPAEKQQIADEAGPSRTHIDNVLEVYFSPLITDQDNYCLDPQSGDIDNLIRQIRAEFSEQDVEQNDTPPINIQPNEIDNPKQFLGYLQGYTDAYNQMTGAGIDLSDLR